MYSKSPTLTGVPTLGAAGASDVVVEAFKALADVLLVAFDGASSLTLDIFAELCHTLLMFIEGATLAALLKESRSVTAAKAQISVAYLMELIEGRKRNPSADVIRRLSDAIGVSVCVLDVHPSRETLEKELMARIGDDPEARRELLSKVRSLGSAA